MSLETAREYLKKFNLDKNILEFNTSSATVAEAAIALNCEEKQIAKTLSFLVDDKPILILAAGNTKIDNPRYKAFFHTKAKMIPFESVEPLIGHPVGGVCPFGIKDGVTVYLDVSLKALDYFYPACGSTNSAIKLTASQLEEITGHPQWIDVCAVRG